jgi:hypothetical protein
MSDESTRSAHGNPPHQGWGEGVPSWWAELERTDLPQDSVTAAAAPRIGTGIVAPRHARRERPQILRAAPGAELEAARSTARERAPLLSRRRLLNAATLALVVVAAVLATWIGLGDASARGLVVVALVFGVPTILTMLAVRLVMRRGGG